MQSGAAKLLAEQVFSPSEHLELISRSTEFLWSLIDHDHDRATIVQWTRQLGDEVSAWSSETSFAWVPKYATLSNGFPNKLATENRVNITASCTYANAFSYDHMQPFRHMNRSSSFMQGSDYAKIVNCTV